MRAGQQLGFPLIAAALNGEAHQHGFHIGAGIEDIEEFRLGHRGDAIAFLIDHRHQPLGHQLRERFPQRPDAKLIARRQQAHTQFFIRLINAADDVVLQPAVSINGRRLGNGGHSLAPEYISRPAPGTGLTRIL